VPSAKLAVTESEAVETPVIFFPYCQRLALLHLISD
jgi:hypothetical protein